MEGKCHSWQQTSHESGNMVQMEKLRLVMKIASHNVCKKELKVYELDILCVLLMLNILLSIR